MIYISAVTSIILLEKSMRKEKKGDKLLSVKHQIVFSKEERKKKKKERGG